MSGDAQNNQTLGGTTHWLDLKGVKAVILFPALATPCLVKKRTARDGVGMDVEGMNVVIAVHQDHIEWLRQASGGSLAKGAPVT